MFRWKDITPYSTQFKFPTLTVKCIWVAQPAGVGGGGDKGEENVEASNRLVHYYSPFNISVIHHPSTLNMFFIR